MSCRCFRAVVHHFSCSNRRQRLNGQSSHFLKPIGRSLSVLGEWMTVRSANGRAGSAIFLPTNALRSAIAKDVRLKRVTKLQQAAFFRSQLARAMSQGGVLWNHFHCPPYLRVKGVWTRQARVSPRTRLRLRVALLLQ